MMLIFQSVEGEPHERAVELLKAAQGLFGNTVVQIDQHSYFANVFALVISANNI